MSKNVIFCYSGTGNCLDMAKNIAKRLGDTDIVMMRRQPAVTDVTGAERVGFIFPCYGGGLPGDVEFFARQVKISPNAYTFGVVQFAGYPGNGLRMIDDIVGLDYWTAMAILSALVFALYSVLGKKLTARCGGIVVTCGSFLFGGGELLLLLLLGYTAPGRDVYGALGLTMVRAAEDTFGPVTLLVNNAGIARQFQFQDITPEYWKRIFDVNLGGAYNTIQAVLPRMLHEHAGVIVNTASIWGLHGASCEAAYSATKHAVVGLTKSLAAELAPTHIRVNAVAPGIIDTDMMRRMYAAFAEKDFAVAHYGQLFEILLENPRGAVLYHCTMTDFDCERYHDINDYIRLIAILRAPDGCPWDRAQTHRSIRRNCLEEAYEVCEAIDEDDPDHLKEELGDLLMQIIFHGGIRKAGFQPGAAVVVIDQLVGAAQSEGAVADAVHPDGGILLDEIVADELPGHHSDVIGRGVMLRVLEKSRAVFEEGVLQPQRFGPLVHFIHKGLLRAAEVFRHEPQVRHRRLSGKDGAAAPVFPRLRAHGRPYYGLPRRDGGDARGHAGVPRGSRVLPGPWAFSAWFCSSARIFC